MPSCGLGASPKVRGRNCTQLRRRQVAGDGLCQIGGTLISSAFDAINPALDWGGGYINYQDNLNYTNFRIHIDILTFTTMVIVSILTNDVF